MSNPIERKEIESHLSEIHAFMSAEKTKLKKDESELAQVFDIPIIEMQSHRNAFIQLKNEASVPDFLTRVKSTVNNLVQSVEKHQNVPDHIVPQLKGYSRHLEKTLLSINTLEQGEASLNKPMIGQTFRRQRVDALLNKQQDAQPRREQESFLGATPKPRSK